MTGIKQDLLFEARQLTISVAETVLLKEFSLDLYRGNRIAITGPSGGGKTSLLRTLCGLISPVSGVIRLKGRTPTEWGWPVFRRRVVYVQQQPALFDETVEAVLRRPFAYRTASAAFPEAQAMAYLQRLGLERELFARQARSLSVGQQQRLCLIRALLLVPEVLLLDEPTSALDLPMAAEVESIVNEECERRGLGTVLVTHDPLQVARWSTQQMKISAFAPQRTVPR